MTPSFAQESTALPQVFVVGDSISIHYGPYLEKHLSGSFRYDRKSGESEALLNLDRPRGANGGDSSMVLSYLRAQFQSGGFAPDLLLVNCGLHDIKISLNTREIQIPLPAYRENLRELTALAREKGIPMVWVRTTHCVDEIHNNRPNMAIHRFAADCDVYDCAACEIMAENDVPILDLRGFTRTLGEDSELFCDHVHFNEAAREKQGAFLAGWLAGWKELRKKGTPARR